MSVPMSPSQQPTKPKDLEQINSELNAALRDARATIARLQLALRTSDARLAMEQRQHHLHHRVDALPFDDAPDGEEAEL